MKLHFNPSIVQYLSWEIFLLFLVFRVWQTARKNPNPFNQYLKQTLSICSIGLGIYCLFFILFANNSHLLWIGNTLGEPFLLVGVIHSLGAFFAEVKPKFPARKLILSLSALAASLSFTAHTQFPFGPFFDKNGILHWNAQVVPGIVYSVFALAMLPFGLMILWKGVKELKNKTTRIYAVTLATVLVVGTVCGIAISLSNQKIVYVLNFLVQIMMFIFLVIGYFQRRKEVSVSQNNQAPGQQGSRNEPRTY